MTAPFERDGWEMTAMALDGSVYLELFEPPDQRRQKYVAQYKAWANRLTVVRKNEQSAWAVNTYMGYAYESYSTVPAEGESRGPDDPAGWSGDVNTNIQVSPVLAYLVLLAMQLTIAVVQVSLFACRAARVADQSGSIVQSAIGNIPLCMGGEVDCVRGELLRT